MSSESSAPLPGHVMIAGGSGLIGRALSAALLARGVSVSVLSRSRPSAASAGSESGSAPRTLRWQPDDPRATQDLMRTADAVVNLCGETIAGPRWSDARKRELWASRTGPATTLCSAIRALAAAGQPYPATYVQASGVGYYGTGEALRDETAPPGEDFLARLAVAWEAPAHALANDAPPGLRLAVARLGVVLHSSGGALPRMLLPFRLFAGGPIAGGRQWLSWIHLEDAVRGLLFMLSSDRVQGACNLTSPEPVRNADFARAAGQALGRPWHLPTPRLALTLALGEQATLVCDGQRALPARLVDHGFGFRYPDIEAALADLTGSR